MEIIHELIDLDEEKASSLYSIFVLEGGFRKTSVHEDGDGSVR